MKYLSRNKVYEKLHVQKDAKKVYIFCEGEDTEIKYFRYFQGFSSNIDIIPIPNSDGQSDPQKLKENAELLFFGNATTLPKYCLIDEYKDEVWFVIDTDRWNTGNKIQILKDFCKSKNKQTNQWFTVQSNPCFELWLYYHFKEVKPNEEDVNRFSSFKEFVNNQIKGGFDKRSMPVELESAIRNSLKNFETENEQPKLYSTEVHHLGQVIIPFVKHQLDIAKEMWRNPKEI
ncbi:MAG: RloB family protein [Bacteroidetes bacterium]|nr:RloB family protein [Bacteroidota bacterium]MBU1721030.1 RloB family protein [Bacteroidota bacterium]